MTVSLTFYGGVDEIGGNKVLLETEKGCVLLDFGRSMKLYGGFFSEFLQVRSKNALRDLLRLGILPKINGVYTQSLVDMTTLFKDKQIADQVLVPDALDYWKFDDIEPCNPKQPFVDGVFISHAHFDHIQDVSFLDPSIPIYCTEQTKILTKAVSNVSTLGVDDQYYHLQKDTKITQKKPSFKTLCPDAYCLSEVKEKNYPIIPDPKTKFSFTHEVTPKERTFNTDLKGNIKDIDYELILVGHSVPGACSVLLTLPDGKRILYTGDLRFHGADEVSIDDYVKAVTAGGKLVDVMITEGTRVDSDNVITEAQVGKDITKDIGTCEGLVLISFGWKDLTRFKTVYEASKTNERILVISPKLAYLLYEMHIKFPTEYDDPRTMKHLQVYLKREGDLLYSAADYDKWKMGYLHFHGRNSAKNDRNLVRIAEYLDRGGDPNNSDNRLPQDDTTCNYQDIYELALHHLQNGARAYQIRQNPKKYVLMFSFWDANELFDLIPQTDNHDTHYISASTEPFSDEMEIDEAKMFQWLDYFKIQYETEQENHTNPNKSEQKVFKRRHVSGHASKSDLQKVINKINPKILIPMHTFNPEKFKDIYKGKIIQPTYAQPIDLNAVLKDTDMSD